MHSDSTAVTKSQPKWIRPLLTRAKTAPKPQSNAALERQHGSLELATTRKGRGAADRRAAAGSPPAPNPQVAVVPPPPQELKQETPQATGAAPAGARYFRAGGHSGTDGSVSQCLAAVGDDRNVRINAAT